MRVTVAAHSSLVIRACGSDNADNLYKWVMENAGKAFAFSILLEMPSQPRWRFDWFTGKHLVADAFGRIDAAITKLPEAARPPSWLERFNKAREWVVARRIELFCALPAIGEGAPRKQPGEDETAVFKTFFDDLSNEPTIDSLLMCVPGFYTIGVTKSALAACHTLFDQLQKRSARFDETNVQYALQVLTFVVVQVRDEALADALMAFCVEKARELPDSEPTLDLVFRLVECAGAFPDHQKGMDILSRRLESLAFVAQAAASSDLLDSLSDLQMLDEALGKRLGRALAATRLARRAA